MAKIKLSILSRNCPHRCIPSQTILIHEAEAWMIQRNNKQATTNWQFTTEDGTSNLHTSINLFMIDMLLGTSVEARLK